MASIARNVLLRQTQLLKTSRISISTSSPRSSSSIVTRLQHAQRPIAAPRIAAFTSSAYKRILPPGPQVIEGGVNDPAPVPAPSPTHGSYHWTFERLISVGLIPLTIAPFAGQTLTPALDAVFVATLLIHSHMGFQSCVTDYFSTWQHPTMRKIADWLLNISTLLVGIAFYEFETNDVGITEAVRRVWHAGANDATVGKADVGALGHDGQLKHLTN